MDIGAGITFGGGVSVTPQPPPPSYKAIFGYGKASASLAITNLVSTTGVVGNDVAGVGSIRIFLAAAGYGTDKAIFGYGSQFGASLSNLRNLIKEINRCVTEKV